MPVTEVTNIAGLSREAFINRMKDQYLPIWPDALNQQKVLMGFINKKVGTIIGGKRSLSSVMVEFSQSAGIALFEDDTLPSPQPPSYENPEIFARAIYGRVRFTGHVERAARAGQSAVWARPVREQLTSARKQWQLNRNRMGYLGPSQILGTVSAAADGPPGTITLHGRDARTSANNDRFKFGAQYLRNKMSIGIIRRTGGGDVDENGTLNDPMSLAANEVTVKNLDKSDADAPTFDLGDATATQTDKDLTTSIAATANNALVVPFRSRIDAIGAPSTVFDSEFAGPNGLLNIIADETDRTFLYSIDRTLQTFLKGNVFRNNGIPVPFSEDRLTLAVDRTAENDAGEGEQDCILAHSSMRREYIKETKGDRRFDEVQTRKGWGQLQFTAGSTLLPIFTDRDCPPGLLFVLDKSSFGWFQESAIHMPDDGERFVANKDSREVVLVESGNCASKTPASNAIIDDQIYSVSGLVDA